MNRLKASTLVLLLSTSFGGCTRPVVQPTATTDTPTTIADLTAPAIPADIAAQLSLPSTLNTSGFGSDAAPADSGGGFPLVPVIAGAAVVGGLFWWFKGRKKVDLSPEELKLAQEAEDAAASGNPAKADVAISKIDSFKKALASVSDQITQDAASLNAKALRGPDLTTFINSKKADYVLLLQGTIAKKGFKNPADIYGFIREINQGHYATLVQKIAQESDLIKKQTLIQAYYKHAAIDLLTVKTALAASVKDLKINDTTYSALVSKLDDVLKYHKASAQVELDKVHQLMKVAGSGIKPTDVKTLRTKWMDDTATGAWNKTTTP